MNAKMRTLIATISSLFLAAALTSCDDIGNILDPTTDAPALKIGVIQPSQYYISFFQGAELARQEINAGGGILGRKIEFVARDNQGTNIWPTPDKTIEAAHDLINNEGVAAILGPIFSTNSIALGNALTEAGVATPMLPAATSPVVTQTHSHFVLTAANNHLHATALANFAASELGVGTVGISLQAGDAYSEVVTRAFVDATRGAGGSVGSIASYEVGSRDFTAQIQVLMDDNPDAIFLPSFAPEVPHFIQQARAAGYEGLFIGADGWDDAAQFYGTLDDNSALNGSYYTTNYFPGGDDPMANDFAAAYMSAYGIIADGIAANGYDAMRLLAEAIETAGGGGTPEGDGDGADDPVVGEPGDGSDGNGVDLPTVSVEVPGADAILDALVAIQGYRGATAISHFDEHRMAVKDLVVLKIANGMPMFHSIWTNMEGGGIDDGGNGDGGDSGGNSGNGGNGGGGDDGGGDDGTTAIDNPNG